MIASVPVHCFSISFRWAPFERNLLIWFTVCSLCILAHFFVISHFVFEGGTLFLIDSVPGNCLPFTFNVISQRITVTVITYIYNDIKCVITW